MAGYNLQVSHYIVAKVQQPELFVRAALKGFEIVFQVSGDTIAEKSRTIWATIHALNIFIQKPGAAAVTVGTARPGVPLRFLQDDGQRSLQHEFVLPLSPGQLLAIDDIRDGGNLALQIAFIGEGGDKAVPGSYFTMYDLHSFTVQKSLWLERLHQAKARDVLLLEVPILFLDDARAAPVTKHFVEAQRMFAEGHYTKAVLDCRKALEALGKLEGRLKTWAPNTLDRLASKDRAQLSKGERELAARASLHHFANLSAHEGDYTREDAKLALVVCAAYISKAFAS